MSEDRAGATASRAACSPGGILLDEDGDCSPLAAPLGASSPDSPAITAIWP